MSAKRSTPSAEPHKWEFKARFRRHAFGSPSRAARRVIRRRSPALRATTPRSRRPSQSARASVAVRLVQAPDGGGALGGALIPRGPVGAGKTTFIERLLGAEVAFAICVRAERDQTLRKEQKSAPKAHAELRRYREAGASAVAFYRFAEPSMDAFFTSPFMQNYSEAVFIEGDCPIDYVDLSVFVAPVPSNGRSLLRRVVRDHVASHHASIKQFAEALENPEALATLLGARLGEPLVAMALKQPRVLDDLRRSMKSKLGEVRRAKPPTPTEHWALETATPQSNAPSSSS